MENGFQKIRSLARNHWEAIACAAAFGILLMLPFVSQRLALGTAFQGIEPELTNDESLYLSCIQEVLDGHEGCGNSYLAEHKDKPPQQLFVVEFVMGQMTRLTGMSVPSARIAMSVALGIMTFLVAYAVAYRILRSRIAAVVVSLTMLFGWYGALMLRPISPQFIFIFWWLMIGSLWWLHERQSGWKPVATAGLFLGSLFYVYPYYWTWVLVFMALMIAGLWFTHRSQAYRWLMALMGGGIIGSGSLLLSFKTSGAVEYTETMTRLGMVTTRFPSGLQVVGVTMAGLLIMGWLLYRRVITWDRTTVFWFAGLLTSIAVVNQHLITSKNFEFSSHYDMQAVCWALLFGLFLLRYFAWRRLAYVGLLGFTLVATWQSFSPLLAVSDATAYRQDYAEVFRWLNNNASPDTVVYANEDLSYWIPVYTSQNVYFSRNAGFFFVSDAELQKRFLSQHYFDIIDRLLIEEQERALVGVRYVDHRGHVSQQNKLRRLLGYEVMPEPRMSDEYIQGLITAGKTTKALSFEQALRPYQVDYVVWDALKNPSWKLGDQTWLKPVFRHNQFVIFARISQFALQ